MSKNEKGYLVFTGGVFDGPAADSMDFKNAKPGQTIWRKTGAFFDTQKDCKAESLVRVDFYSRLAKSLVQNLACLPDGVNPK